MPLPSRKNAIPPSRIGPARGGAKRAPPGSAPVVPGPMAKGLAIHHPRPPHEALMDLMVPAAHRAVLEARGLAALAGILRTIGSR